MWFSLSWKASIDELPIWGGHCPHDYLCCGCCSVSILFEAALSPWLHLLWLLFSCTIIEHPRRITDSMYLHKCQQCSMNYVLPPKLLWGRLVGVQEQAECISALFLWDSGLLSTSYNAVALQLLWQPCRIHFSSVNYKPTKITDANIEKYDPIHVCYHVSKKNNVVWSWEVSHLCQSLAHGLLKVSKFEVVANLYFSHSTSSHIPQSSWQLLLYKWATTRRNQLMVKISFFLVFHLKSSRSMYTSWKQSLKLIAHRYVCRIWHHACSCIRRNDMYNMSNETELVKVKCSAT